MQHEGNGVPWGTVAQAVAKLVAQALLALGEQQLQRAGPILIEADGPHRGDQRSGLARPAACRALRDADHRDVAAALDLPQQVFDPRQGQVHSGVVPASPEMPEDVPKG